jgi:Integral peroxisomal membrane peroxin
VCRIGIVFVFQNRLIRLFTWRNPTHTLSFLSVYLFVCIDPYLLVVLPLAVLLLFIMVPTFVARHPPPPPSSSTSSTTPYYSYQGPALAPPKTIRPAAETSKDFFRNMRDLQNSMADFTLLHDVVVKTIAPLTNFSNEILSSIIFLYLTLLTTSLFIIAHLIPWRLIFLVGGTALIISGHPTVQTWLAKQKKRAETSAPTSQPAPRLPFLDIALPTSPAAAGTLLTTLSAITLDSAPETREVEIFELQHRPLHSSSEWEPHLFTPTPYDPLSPARISGDRPHGTRFFEDVQPPRSWAWEGPKWELDLEPREWVAERLVTGVEFDALTGTMEGDDDDDDDDDADAFSLSGHRGEFGGWVWDLPPTLRSPGIEEYEMWMAYGEEYDVGKKKDKEAKERIKREAQVGRDWEEGRWAGRTGEWRRRRWVRVVRRVGVSNSDEATKS